MSQKVGRELPTRHIWMVDDRSLCDRRAFPPATPFDEFANDDEFDRYLDGIERAPACGACLLLAGRIRRQASALIAQNKQIHPKDPRDGWASLHDTRWARQVDLKTFLDRDDLDQIRYNAVDLEVDPGSVKQLVDEQRELIEAAREDWTRYRSELNKEDDDDDSRP